MWSKTKVESRRVKDEKTSLIPGEYDTVCTDEDMSLSNTTLQQKQRTASPREIESEYSEIRSDLITRPSDNRDSHSRSGTPADTNPTAGSKRNTATSYGAVGRESEETRYSYIHVDKQRWSVPRAPSDVDGYTSAGYTRRTRVTTNIYQVRRHSLLFFPQIYTPSTFLHYPLMTCASVFISVTETFAKWNICPINCENTVILLCVFICDVWNCVSVCRKRGHGLSNLTMKLR